MSFNQKRRKRENESLRSSTGIKKAKLEKGRSVVASGSRLDNYDSELDNSNDFNKSRMNDGLTSYREGDEESNLNVPENGIDFSDLMALNDNEDDSKVEDSYGRATDDHIQMIRSLKKNLGLENSKRSNGDFSDHIPADPENPLKVTAEGSAKLDISELIDASDSTKETRKQLKKLAHSDRRLQVELPKPKKDRIERVVQYEDTKQIMSEWLPTVQTMRQAERVIFPLPEQRPQKVAQTTSDTRSNYEPQTELEKAVFGILEESGISEQKLQEAETLATKKMSQQELLQKQRQMARLRSLFFYQEQKNKRQAKIKSKKYRKLLKKQKEKNEPTLDELKELDPDRYELELEKLDKARALERMGIKHRNLGRWAQYALKSKDPQLMQAAREHLERGRKLRQQIRSDRGGSDDEDDSGSDISSSYSEDGENQFDQDENEMLTKDADNHLTDILDINGERIVVKRKNENSGDENENSGILGMKFMKRAAAKRQQDHKDLMDQMDRDISIQKEKLRAQQRKNHDDYMESGLKADSDSDEEVDDADHGESTNDSKSNFASFSLSTGVDSSKAGRKKVAENSAQITAKAMIQQRKSIRKQVFGGIEDESSDDELGSSSMLLDPPDGFSSNLASGFSIKSDKTKRKQTQITARMDIEDDSSNEDDGQEDSQEPEEISSTYSFSFAPNSNNGSYNESISSRMSKDQHDDDGGGWIRAEPGQDLQELVRLSKAHSKRQTQNQRISVSSSSSKTTPVTTKAPKPIDDDGGGWVRAEPGQSLDDVIKRANQASVAKQRGIMKTLSNDYSNSVNGPKTAASSDSNPWMNQEDEDETPIHSNQLPKGSNSQTSNGSTQKKSQKSKNKKLNEHQLAVDLETVHKQLVEDEKNRDVQFNLTAARETSKAQKELISRAFASDHVTEDDILAEKEQQVEAANEVEKEYAMLTLPGWGEWAGSGTKPSAKRQRILKEVEKKKAEKSAELMASRQDAKLKHAIITSRENKYFVKYQTSSIPHEFNGNAQFYEASLRQPMGREWNTRSSHAGLVAPSVVVHSGFVIDPIQKKRETIQRKST